MGPRSRGINQRTIPTIRIDLSGMLGSRKSLSANLKRRE